jgi:CRISPR-associated protein Csd2
MADAKRDKVVDRRYDFLIMFDCVDGNPNGDPDFNNAPRTDPETFQGLVSNGSLKRKIRDFHYYKHSQGGKVEKGQDIFVLAGHALESRQRMSYDNLKIDPEKATKDDIAQARDWMCANFFDVRAFGAVMSTTAFNNGQVTGPVQITDARSVSRVLIKNHMITRVAYTTQEKTDSHKSETEMGSKYTIPYGLYVAEGFVNPMLAADTGFTYADLDALWEAIIHMFDLSRSAGRGRMSTRRLFVWEHADTLGNCQAFHLFEAVQVALKDDVLSPRVFTDYMIMVPEKWPAGVTFMDKTEQVEWD